MDTSSKSLGVLPRENSDAPPVARQGVTDVQSNGRAMQRMDAIAAQNAGELPRLANAKRRSKVVYWPTTPLTSEQMVGAILSADRQDEVVMAIFRHHIGEELAASQVWCIGAQGGRKWPVTSVRRSINTLTNCGALDRSERIHDGPNGRVVPGRQVLGIDDLGECRA